MSNDLGSQVYNLNMSPLVTLWQIDFLPLFPSWSIGGDAATVYCTSYLGEGRENIVFDGNTYDYVGIQASGFRTEINGQLVEPTITFDKISLEESDKYQTAKFNYTAQRGKFYFDWRGANVTRIRTTLDLLTDPTKGQFDYYVVNQTNRTNKNLIEVGISVSIAADSINNTSVQSLAPNTCALKYRLWDEDNSQFVYKDEGAGGCPYGNPTTISDWSNVPDFGEKYFDEDDSELDAADKSGDKCSLTLGGCQARFDPDKYGLVLPFTGLYSAASATNDPKDNPPDQTRVQ